MGLEVSTDKLTKVLQRCGADDEATNGFDLDDVMQQIIEKTGHEIEDARQVEVQITMEAFQKCLDEHSTPIKKKAGRQGLLSQLSGFLSSRSSDDDQEESVGKSEKVNSEEPKNHVTKHHPVHNQSPKYLGQSTPQQVKISHSSVKEYEDVRYEQHKMEQTRRGKHAKG